METLEVQRREGGSFAQSFSFDLLSLVRPNRELTDLSQRRKSEYVNAAPYPHIVIDDFLPEWVAKEALNRFPSPEESIWLRTDIADEKKLSVNEELSIPPFIRNLLLALNSLTFLRFMEDLTGIKGLLPDPFYVGGGLHQTVRGGKLGVHLDFNKHDKMNLDRRLNLLVYLNQDWKESFGGDLEIWDANSKQCVRKIAPVFNRCVIFNTDDKSYHGHPHPLTTPPGVTRKSLALYYYTQGRPRSERSFVHGTDFIDHRFPGNSEPLWMKVKRWIRELTPPLVYNFAKKMIFKYLVNDPSSRLRPRKA